MVHARAQGILLLLAFIALILITCLFTDVLINWYLKLRGKHIPTRSARARVVDKRTSRLDLAFGEISNTDDQQPKDAFVSFFFDGRTLELVVPDRVYLAAADGSEGILTYHGNTAVDFKPLS